ncbi:CLUMA_CG015602, isoform A [Clunio marinus]|uniref:CLUMA_CG015602, isoform A n=1 Tax=Clunio marinus TaxID=568069 RepID=A0A1J1IU33_9DIPT|nr:CLUMA_CG015602, isoform A [Clunio marinus]
MLINEPLSVTSHHATESSSMRIFSVLKWRKKWDAIIICVILILRPANNNANLYSASINALVMPTNYFTICSLTRRAQSSSNFSIKLLLFLRTKFYKLPTSLSEKLDLKLLKRWKSFNS